MRTTRTPTRIPLVTALATQMSQARTERFGRALLAFISAGLLVAIQSRAAQVAAPVSMEPKELEEIAEVVVTGEQPGPALWRVTSGEHVVWLLGTVAQTPKRVTWRSKQLEAVLSKSQEVLLDQGVATSAPTNAEQIALRRAINLPDGKTLKEVLPSDLYARVERARHDFAKSEKGFEKLRPFCAANRIANGSVERLGLAPLGALRAVSNLARKMRVPVTAIADSVGVAPSLLVLESVAETTPCLEGAVAILEDEGSGVRALANAWAVGDIVALRQLIPLYDMGSTRMAQCGIALNGNGQSASRITTKHAEKWLAAVERSLATNKSTVAVVSMAELLAPDGFLEELRTKGYEVVEPL